MPRAHKSQKGQLLLDHGRLAGSWFHRTVVFVCQHDREGAFGLVLNRRFEKPVGQALVAELPANLAEQPLFLGGPVQSGTLSFLHTGLLPTDADIIPRVNVGHSLEELIELAGEPESLRQYRVFAGYAGWGPGQLDDELKRDSWVTHPASVELMFGTPPESIWANILRLKGWRYRLAAEAPDDLSSN